MSTRLIATLMPGKPEDVAEWLRAPPTGVDYAELRLDALAEPTPDAVKQLLALPRSVPIIATCRAPSQGGHGGLDDQTRLALLTLAGEAGADVLDVEDTLLAELPFSTPGDRLASCHLKRHMPRLSALAKRVVAHGTRFAKLAVPADSPKQLVALLALQEELGESIAVVPTGRLALAGRVMMASRGSPLTYGAADDQARGHPDQPTVAALHDDCHVQTVLPSTRFLAVVGSPVRHSMSPRYHNAVLRGVARNTRMVPLDVDDLASLMPSVDALRLDGMAVTFPLKRQALGQVHAVMPGARQTGAANTLLRTPAGWQARNTDWKAACDLLPRMIKAWRFASTEPAAWVDAVITATWKGTTSPGARGKGEGRGPPKILLLGAGGAARAIAVALFEQDVELAIWSRRLAHARSLAEELADDLPAVAVPDPSHATADIVINATPVGMAGVDPFELSAMGPVAFRPGAVLIDLTYGGGLSPVRDAATAANVPIVDGKVFFGLQARRQAEVFTDGAASAELRRNAAAACGLDV